MQPSGLIPVHVLTGALGSGKTTLLNRLLQGGFGADTAVVVNEFGDIALDQLFIAARSDETIVLKSGCICCTMRTDLVSTLLGLLARPAGAAALKRVIIETSGISDPVPILQTLRSDFNLATRFCVAGVICTADAAQGSRLADGPEAIRQLSAADAIVLTKLDVAHDHGQAARATVSAHNPIARVVEGAAELVNALGEGNLARRADHEIAAWMRLPARVQAGHEIRSTVIRGIAPPSWPRFAVWLTRLVFMHGDRILRTKGVLFDAARNRWIGVHGVRRFFHPPVHLDLAQAPEFGACLVFITQGLDPAQIEASYHRLAHSTTHPQEEHT
ncbi:MAG TPA: GTP-binding protein [Casimicrobiaceae bacterium]|nr:GTP-binding protein [Casimicrobiaceae bacterium]